MLCKKEGLARALFFCGEMHGYKGIKSFYN